MEIKMKLLEA